MDKNIILNILKSAENLLVRNEISIAKEYIRLEIENLEGITPNKCRFISKPSHCNICHNLNCPDNKNKQ